MNQLTAVAEITSFVKPTYKWQQIAPRKEELSVLPDGSRVLCNESGQIEYAQYQNGATLGRFYTFALVANSPDGHWFRDRENRWHRFD